jgi:hypothetical protein
VNVDVRRKYVSNGGYRSEQTSKCAMFSRFEVGKYK